MCLFNKITTGILILISTNLYGQGKKGFSAATPIDLSSWKLKSVDSVFTLITKNAIEYQKTHIYQTTAGDTTFVSRVYTTVSVVFAAKYNTVTEKIDSISDRALFDHQIVNNVVLPDPDAKTLLYYKGSYKISFPGEKVFYHKHKTDAEYTKMITESLTSLSLYKNILTARQRRIMRTESLFKRVSNPGCLYVGFSYIPSIAYRKLLINTALFNEKDAYYLRHSNESIRYGSLFSGRIGFNYKRSHLYYLEYIHCLVQGFKGNKSAVIWNTGLADTTSGVIEEKFTSSAIGIGYSYKLYNMYRYFNFAGDFGIYGTFLKPGKAQPAGTQSVRVGAKVGIGVNFKPCYGFEIGLIPTLLYDLTAIGKGDIKTNLYNFGLSVTVGFNFTGKTVHK